MDADRFDAVARALPLGSPRRVVLGGGLAAALAALLAGRTEDAEARKKKGKKKRKNRNQNQNECQAEEIKCFGQCVNPRFDPNNCGGCGIFCPAGACLNGTCICRSEDECPTGCGTCGPRLGGGDACLSAVDFNAPCDEFEDCSNLGSFCPQSGFCTVGCTG